VGGEDHPHGRALRPHQAWPGSRRLRSSILLVRPLLAGALLVSLAGCGGGATTHRAPPRAPSKPSSTIRVRLTAQSHQPRVGKPWRYEVRVTDAAGKPVPADVRLQILYGGIAVGQVGRHHLPKGVWRERIGAGGNQPFPARARGQRLVLEAVVRAKGQTKKVDYWIRVR
jgi:hypothetical protein